MNSNTGPLTIRVRMLPLTIRAGGRSLNLSPSPPLTLGWGPPNLQHGTTQGPTEVEEEPPP